MVEVVFFVLKQLAPLLQEEVKQLSGVRKEVEYIRDELQRMMAFLAVVDATEESDLQLQVWVKQVQGVAYHTEDVLDEFTLQLAHHHGKGFHKAFRSFMNIKVRSQVASEIKIINTRVRNNASGYDRYRNWCGGSSSTDLVTNTPCDDDRNDALLRKEGDLVGMVDRKKELTSLLLVEGDSRLKVVTVSGMPGLGKTTLVKRVYEDMKLTESFSNHVWLTVSESHKMEELLNDMIQQLYSEIEQPVPQGVETMTITRMKVIINDFLQHKKYLVVFDDVSSTRTWEVVRHALPDNDRSSRVVLTTRLQNPIATHDTSVPCPLMPLSPENSWTLFCKNAFLGNSCPPHLEASCRIILERCDGLPLAIEAIAGVLAMKQNITIEELGRLEGNILVESEGNYQVDRMKRILSLSYNGLPYHLKICFLYLSIFPKNLHIERMRLVRLWTAEGFVQDKRGKPKEEVAEGYLNDLINRSLIQVEQKTGDGRVKTCRIHDIYREILTSKSSERNIVAIAGIGCPDEARRLAIHKSLGNVQQSMCFSKLRSLLMFGVADTISKSSMPMLFNGDLRLVKVLELRGASLETLPDEVFKLFHLRYLSLRGTKVKKIPNLIRNLENLETLDLKHTHVTELPIGISKLTLLRHLLVYRRDDITDCYQTIHGFRVPTKIGSSWTSIQQLCYIDASHEDSGTIVRELGSFTQLRRLGIVKLKSKDGMALCSSLEKLTNLRSLAISSITGEKIVDIQSLSSWPQYLGGLYLSGRLDNLPVWIPSLNDLVKIYLGWSELRDDPLQSLQSLPKLVHIELHRAYEGEELCFSRGGFPSLNILRLSELNKLKRLRMEQGAVPQLEKLYINNCEAVEEVPSGIEHLGNLKFFDFSGVSHALVKSLERKTCKDFWKIRHIPFIWIEVPRSRLR